MNIHVARHNHDATRVLTRGTLDACQALYQLGYLGRMGMAIILFIILFNITNGGFISHRSNCSRTAHIVAAEKLLCVLVRHFLVGQGMSAGVIRVMTARKIQINIGNLVPMEAQENGEGDIVSIPHHGRAALRTSLRRQIKARIHLVFHEKLAVTTFRTAIMGLQRIDLSYVQHGGHKGGANATTGANKVATV